MEVKDKLFVNDKESCVLSVVIPAFNEELVIQDTIDRVVSVLNTIKVNYEILVVNDGSTDNTLEVIGEIRKRIPIRVVNIVSNAGHMRAIRAGLEASIGDYIVTLDADLQDPPEYIPEMFKLISSPVDIKKESGEGEKSILLDSSYDVIQAFREDREVDSFWKKNTASLYYKIIRKLTGINLISHAADFRIMKREVVNELIALKEQKLVYRLLIPSLGFKIKALPIKREPRFLGESKYDNRKMMSLAIDSVIGHTVKPLRFFALLGISVSAILLLGSFVTLSIYLICDTIPGWTPLLLLYMCFNMLLFAGLGLVGEYVGRIYQLVQNRPYIRWTEI